MQAKFIVIEGLEGAGKSTAIATILNTLELNGINQVVQTREPGGTPLAEKLRTIIKQEHQEKLCDETECLLMYAARMQLLANVIEPALQSGKWVIGDRHDLSSRAYQGGGRGLSELVDRISDIVLAGRKPDLTLYLDIDPRVGLTRAAARGELDRIEKQELSFFERTRQRYLDIANEDDSIVIIDAQQDIDKVQQDINMQLQQAINQWQ
ncbi:dTMP kinase [Paraferrimonas sp. SM1919]|uniref:dTMP kinase n=1 Tax=Paraferrimonas sp. SM1919 TaxID=2662263 RepID=UPI0013D5070F|nr:dTMP kinase [Paraferrimonas sp. SM1919]